MKCLQAILATALALWAGAANASTVYWSLFNIEGESSIAADYVTYGSLTDMLADANRTGTFTMSGAGRNIVGSGSDGTTYWSLFNIEGESSIASDYVTYGSLTDMLADANRTGTFTMSGAGRNIVGSGAGMLAVAPPPPPPAAVIPLPAGFWLLGTALAVLGCAAGRRAGRNIAAA